MLPPEDRLIGAQLHRYISDKLYWVLHAPRQTGKTTFLMSWMNEINSGDEAVSCYVSVERCQGIIDINVTMPAICEAIMKYAEAYNVPVPTMPEQTPAGMLHAILVNWAQLVSPKPLIVLFDEVDTLEGETMISFLRQLRDGFAMRGVGTFPVSIALVGMRDLKDYITASKEGVLPNPGSPFNIKADSALIGNFSQEDIIRLFAQHTEETGQQITADALNYVWEQSQGQPWIVNNIFQRATMRVLDYNNTETVTINHVKEARQQMVIARETHLDSLAYRLAEPRIRHIIETIMTGDIDPQLGQLNPDVQLTMDLGLIRWDGSNGFIISNPVYEEILTRYFNSGYHANLPPPTAWKWQNDDGSLNMDNLLKEFQQFWRRHSEIWEAKADYTEAFPHLLLMAFLQRITNGEGDINREAAAGRGRLDLEVKYHGQVFILEIKIIHYYDTPKTVQAEGLEQICNYRQTVNPIAPAYLIIFDRRPKAKKTSWDKRIGWDVVEDITIVKC